MKLTAFLRGKRDGGGVPSIVRILSDLSRFSNPLGKAAKTRDFGGGFILILLLKQQFASQMRSVTAIVLFLLLYAPQKTLSSVICQIIYAQAK